MNSPDMEGSYFFIHVFAGGVCYAGIPHSGYHHKRQTDSRGEDISHSQDNNDLI